MSYDLELRDLKYFEAIAELGHVGKAAQKLHLSQPALTSCVRRLEDTFGTPLFQRMGRGIQLTPAGGVLLARARHVRLVTDDAVREMEQIARGGAGNIRIGVVPSMASLLLPSIQRRFLTETTGVRLKTVIAHSSALKMSLKAGDIDLVISFDESRDDDLHSEAILEDVVVVVAGSSHEIFRKRIRMKDLVRYDWLLADSSVGTRRWLDQAFDSHGLPRPVAQMETNIILLLPRLIAETGLLTFISRRHVSPGSGGSLLREVRLKETTMRRWCKVIYRKEGYLLPATGRLLKLLCTSGKTLFEGS